MPLEHGATRCASVASSTWPSARPGTTSSSPSGTRERAPRSAGCTASVENTREGPIHRGSGPLACLGGLASGVPHDERHVVAPEPERVVDRVHRALGGQRPRLTADEVHRELRLRVADVDGGRREAFADREDREDGLHGPGAAEEVTGHRLGGGHQHGLAAHAGDGLGLHQVAGRGGGGVGVDVGDVVALDAGVGHGEAHRALLAGSGRVGGRDVVGVRGHADAREDGVDPGAPGLGVLTGLQHHDAGALTHDEAVTIDVVGTAGALRVVAAGGQGLHLGEGGDGHGVDRGLGATGDHHVGPAGADHLHRIGDGLRAGGAGRDRGVGAGLRAEPDRDEGGGGVGHEHGHGHREDAPGALLLDRVPRAEDGPHPADAGGDHHAEPFGLDVGGAGVGPRLLRRDHGVLGGGVHPLDVANGKDVTRRHLEGSGEVHGDAVAFRPVVVQGSDAGGAGEGRGPRVRDVPADGVGGPQSGDDNFLACSLLGVGVSSGLGLGDEVDRVLHGREAGGVLVGDAHLELLLGVGLGDRHHRQGVDVEVVGERGLGRHLLGGEAGLLGDDLGEACEDLGFGQCHVFVSPGVVLVGEDEHLCGVRQTGSEADLQGDLPSVAPRLTEQAFVAGVWMPPTCCRSRRCHGPPRRPRAARWS